MQVANEETVLGDFSGAILRYQGIQSRFFRKDRRFFVRTDGPDGRLKDFEVRYTFGVDPLQQFLVELDRGRLQPLPFAWDTRPKKDGGQRWFHLYPKEKLVAGDELHWTGRQQNWNFMCADCHSTGIRRGYVEATDSYNTHWDELSVGCEACHGPGSNHVAWAEAGAPNTPPSRGLTVNLSDRASKDWTINPVTGSASPKVASKNDAELGVCVPCHSRRAQFREGFQAGASFLDFYRPSLIEPDLYYSDGQQKDEVFEWGSFLQSRMHQAGVRCSDCHEPHSADLRVEGNALCARCHAPEKFDVTAHHHHAPESSGSQCVECHMPSRLYMLVDARRDHSLRVPRPDLAASLSTPEPCSGCHTSKTPEWAAAQIQNWLGRPAKGLQNFAEALDAARTGKSLGPMLLTRLIEDSKQPEIARASAAQALGSYRPEEAFPTVSRILTAESPLVRRAGLSALGSMGVHPEIATPLLKDPVLQIRIQAAALLAGIDSSTLGPNDRAARSKAFSEYVELQRAGSDRAEARTNLGTFLARQGQMDEGVALLQGAAKFDPRFVPAWVNLAGVLASSNREPEAESTLREGLAHVPREASLYHALGLSFVRQHRTAEALTALARAKDLDPQNLRFGYTYAVALHSVGRTREALKEIDAALKRHPEDLDLLTAGFNFSRVLGDASAMEPYVSRLAKRRQRP